MSLANDEPGAADAGVGSCPPSPPTPPGEMALPGRSPPSRGDAPAAINVERDTAGLYSAHFPRLVALAARVLGDADEAEDVAQEALIAAWTALRAGYRLRCPGAWLSRVVRNLAISRLRRRADQAHRCTRIGALGGPGAGSSARDADPAAAVVEAEAIGRIVAGLSGLRPRHREDLLLHLRAVDGAAAATALGLSQAAWRARLGRAREALRLALQESPAPDADRPLRLPARRARVAELHAAGLRPAAIARALGLARSTVLSDLTALRRRPPATMPLVQLRLFGDLPATRDSGPTDAGQGPASRRPQTPNRTPQRRWRRRCRGGGAGMLPLWPAGLPA